MYYSSAPYDRLVKTITVATWIGLVVLTVFFLYFFLFFPPSSYLLGLAVVVFMTIVAVAVLLGTFLFSPSGYRLTSKGVTIERPFRSFAIPYDNVEEVNRLEWIWKGIRLGGSGGLYGYLGLFYLSGIGRVWMYVTNKNKVILIKSKNGKQYAISPDNLDFLEKLKDKLTEYGNRDNA